MDQWLICEEELQCNGALSESRVSELRGAETTTTRRGRRRDALVRESEWAWSRGGGGEMDFVCPGDPAVSFS
jgi:hypothetical protein